MADETKPDDSEPTPERQAELRAAYEANVAAGKAPYARIAIRTRGELLWVMRERDWTGEGIARGKERPDLSGAEFYGANLSGADLRRANLSGANFEGGANLSGADFFFARLHGASFVGTNLKGANLRLAHMDADTLLRSIALDTETRLGDVVWNGAPLSQVDWSQAPRLGDDQAIAEAKTRQDRIGAYRSVVRTYRQLATVLRAQGMNEDADRYAYRAQVLQRRGRWQQRQWLRWFGSFLLALVAGYGYRPLRSFAAYAVVILGFMGLYLLNSQFVAPHLMWNEALVLSMSSFHGRGFFNPGISLGDTYAELAAAEAFIGLLIEITFIATFTQRFFAR